MVVRILIVALYLGCFLRRAGGFPVADEMDFIKPIEAWVQGSPQEYGLWHAPWYPWVLSLLGKVFGFHYLVARSVGFFTTLTAAILMCFAAKKARPRIEDWKISLVLALGLLSPVCLGSALLLDYDTTFLVASTAFYFYLLTRFEESKVQDFKKVVLVFGAALFLALASKETTPLVYPMGLLVLLWRPWGVVRALSVSVLSGLLGVVLYLGTTWLWCKAFALPFSAPFQMDLLGLKVHGAATASAASANVGAALWVKTFPLFWIGLPVGAWFCFRAPRIFRSGGARAGILVCILLVILAYTFALRQMTYHFPKYMAPVLPWLMWLLVVDDFKESENLVRRWLPGVALLYLGLPDPLLVLYSRNANGLTLSLFSAFIVLSLWALVRRWKPEHLIQFSTLIVLIGLGQALAYGRAAFTKKGSITYWYGDRSIREAREQALHWRQLNPKGLLYVPAKDLAHATQEFGSEHLQKDLLGEKASALCNSSEPWLVITRIREDSSLLKENSLKPLLKCASNQAQGVDIVYASAYSQQK